MSNFYSDLLNSSENVDIMDDEDDLEIETDFLKGTQENIGNKSKSESNIYDDNQNTISKPKTDQFNWLLSDDNDRKMDAKNLRFHETESDNILDDIKDTSEKPKSAINRSKKENILSELFGVKSSPPTSILHPPSAPAKSESNITRTMSSRRPRRNSAVGDPLGLFSSPVKTQKPEVIEPVKIGDAKVEKSDNLPDWLAAGSKPSVVPKPLTTSNIPTTSDIPKPEKKIEIETEKIDTTIKLPQDNPLKSDQSSSSLSVLHQQESQLLLMMQLKQFEKRLMEIETRQSEAIEKQQNNFNKLFNEHITNYKKSIDDQIINQQMKINEQMQMLVLSSTSTLTDQQKSNIWKENIPKDVPEMQMDHAFIEEMKIHHSNEHLMLENSYKKRIEILEDSLSSNESIFKLEIERIKQYYNEQIQMYENQLELHEKKFTEKLDKLEQDHRNEIKSINEHYQSMIDTLNLEHTKVIENIRKCKMNEHLILMLLVESLESKLNEQNLIVNESKWTFENREANFAAREAALERESIRMKELFDRERAYIDKMKQEALEENEKLNAQILEARLTLAAEKSRLETEGKLKNDNNYEVLKSRTEVDAAIKAAQNAIELATEERNKLAEERRQIEIERQSLQSTERRLLKREDDLNNMLKQCERKKDEAAQMLNESKMLEMKYNEQHKSLQNQMASLRLREKKLAEDKVLISKERIALHRGAGGNEPCPTCSSGVHSNEFSKDKLLDEIESTFVRCDNNQDKIN
ncbi:uncharacterized protein PFB0765w [Chrysoperla carnea]|uniref:uncharacterized protein PFB0765w n=1 Tax=Chrysoperla carnea TaxID=189513 RepID=UPI001D071C20|nr:uncharacterized protein PFB0765w [Chrysoperla carnea]